MRRTPRSRAALCASANMSREPGVPCNASTDRPLRCPYSAQAIWRPSGSLRMRTGDNDPVGTNAPNRLLLAVPGDNSTADARTARVAAEILLAADNDIAWVDHQDHVLALVETKCFKRGDG